MRQFNHDRDAPSAGGSTSRSEHGGGFGLDDLLRQLTEGQGRGQGGGGVSQPSAPGAGSGPGAGGGLAYKAYQNYRNGQSPEAARIYIRGMIAAAASDGRLDSEEQQRILGSLQQQGLNREAEEFLAHELNNPATIDELARGVRDEAEALQLYTAARVAIDPDTRGEQEFL